MTEIAKVDASAAVFMSVNNSYVQVLKSIAMKKKNEIFSACKR
jgi:hypothetical protein